MADADKKLPSLLSPEIKRKLISADDARQLMVKSVRGLDAKLAEVSRIIQNSARKGETKAEVYSLQTGRSNTPIYERMDNLGRVLMEALRYAGYESKLKEFRTSDSCMLYIMADWSEIRSEPEEADRPTKKTATGSTERPSAESQRPDNSRTNLPPVSRRANSGGPVNTELANRQVDSKEGGANQDDANSDAASAESPQSADADAESDGEVKTKKFDRSKMTTTVDKKAIASLAGVGDLKGKDDPNAGEDLGAKDEVYGYSKESSGERVPIVLPVVTPL